MSNLGIVGYGIVGKAVEYGFKGGGNIIRHYDKYKESDSLEEVVRDSEFIFVCLPTPYNSNKNRIDLGIMDENVDKIARLSEGEDKVVVMKSSVVPGTTRAYAEKYKGINFCFNPEFLTEANYLQDFVNADRIVIGADSDRTRLRVTDLYRDRFPNTPVFLTDLVSAEMVKYSANCYLATKVIFANEMFDLCSRMGVNYDEVKKMVVADKRIFDSHLDVTSVRGFGGKCFPKDIVALIGLFEDMDVDASLLKTVWEKNLRIRKLKDWEDIPFVKSE
ncbi:MAG: hypothetical protein Q7S27_03410 [Nanoarchaeota archaeon]|nr:hypothetical protein [Nanoarchaeota archaeon]